MIKDEHNVAYDIKVIKIICNCQSFSLIILILHDIMQFHKTV